MAMKNGAKHFALTLWCIAALYQMAFADTDKQGVCKQLQEISPDADPSAYKELAQQFKQAGLTACACTKFLTEARIAAQKEPFNKQWGFDQEDWQAIDDFKARVAKQDSHSGSMTCAIDPALNLPATFKDDIVKMFAVIDCNNGHIYVKSDSTINPAALGRYTEYFPLIMQMPLGGPCYFAPKNFGEYINRAHATAFSLLLNPEFATLSASVKKGILLHEIYGHGAHGDSVSKQLLLSYKQEYRPTFHSSRQDFLASMAGLDCAHEARADQVPAACGSMDDALCMQAWIKDMHEKYGDKYDKKDHDMPAERLAAVTRIVKLRQAFLEVQ